MLIKLIPLLYTLATNPDISPVIPPPILIIKSVLLKFFNNSLLIKYVTDFNDLVFSFGRKFKFRRSYFFNFFITFFLYLIGKLLSKISAILLF